MRNVRPFMVMQLAFVVLTPLLLALFIGLEVDSRLGSSPWGVLLAALTGMALSLVLMYRLVTNAIDKY